MNPTLKLPVCHLSGKWFRFLYEGWQWSCTGTYIMDVLGRLNPTYRNSDTSKQQWTSAEGCVQRQKLCCATNAGSESMKSVKQTSLVICRIHICICTWKYAVNTNNKCSIATRVVILSNLFFSDKKKEQHMGICGRLETLWMVLVSFVVFLSKGYCLYFLTFLCQ